MLILDLYIVVVCLLLLRLACGVQIKLKIPEWNHVFVLGLTGTAGGRLPRGYRPGPGRVKFDMSSSGTALTSTSATSRPLSRL